MIAISLPSTRRSWSTLSFTSTLYLCPVLDLLLTHIPANLKAEIRLGLQEALVNAAKHGNKLDPTKSIIVQFSITKAGYSWVISDQGCGFVAEGSQVNSCCQPLPPEESENGRGLCILHQIFDQVHWNKKGTKLKLCKQLKKSRERQAIFS